MSCLVETLSSDDEDHIIGRGNDEDDEEDEAMNEEFEFGGMLVSCRFVLSVYVLLMYRTY